MSSRRNDTTTTPDLTTLQDSLARLATAAHILDGFVHRNKNQHRGTRWWGPFSMLRSSVRKLLPDLEGAVRRADVLSTPAFSGAATKRRKTDKGVGGSGRVAAAAARQPELDRVVERARWVHEVVGAKAYEAFTQVAADRQFAQLGLALIGVLAQVEAAMTPFVRAGPDADSDSDSAGDELGVSGRARAAGAEGDGVSVAVPGGLGRSASLGGDDLGVAISRDELGDDDAPARDEKSVPPQGGSPSRKDEKGDTVPRRAKAKAEGGLARKRKDAEPQRVDSKVEKKVKKRKKKGGDEFDDLFSTLL